MVRLSKTQKGLDFCSRIIRTFILFVELETQWHDAISMELCAPYCTCRQCNKLKGYIPAEEMNRQQTIQTYYDIDVPTKPSRQKQAILLPSWLDGELAACE